MALLEKTAKSHPARASSRPSSRQAVRSGGAKVRDASTLPTTAIKGRSRSDMTMRDFMPHTKITTARWGIAVAARSSPAVTGAGPVHRDPSR
ncbi:hypothetical protein [Streptomyces luridiscabiei]|uniref:hypothetical protein n=1 Tax=Streptomyces luridiscabiei TaxID=164114 RepID=UPI00131AA390|nr:hypothetical protein [Streptomyces luridiscabiei]